MGLTVKQNMGGLYSHWKYKWEAKKKKKTTTKGFGLEIKHMLCMREDKKSDSLPNIFNDQGSKD